MLEGRAQMSKSVLVVGGGMVGCEAAEYLAERGHQVAIIEMKDIIAADVTPENRRYMFENFEANHVVLRPGAKVTQFYTDGVDYVLSDGSAGSLRGVRQHRSGDGLPLQRRAEGNRRENRTAGVCHRRGCQGARQRRTGYWRRAGSSAADLIRSDQTRKE